MKKFIFRLQNILNYREFLKDEAQADLAKALAVEREIEIQLETIAKNYAAVKSSTVGTSDFSVISSANQYYVLLDRKKEELLLELAKAQMVSEQKREVLNEAMQEMKSLEKLRDKQHEQWKKDFLAEEELVADEVNIGRRFRR